MFADLKYLFSGNLQLLHVLKAAWELRDRNYPGELSIPLLTLSGLEVPLVSLKITLFFLKWFFLR